jgi:dTDP-4-amino-4,6-dideoxygalactose transaminase
MAAGLDTASIPTNSSCLEWRDYLPYLTTWSRSPVSADALELTWSALLPDRRLVPAPTGRHALWLFLERAGLAPGSEVLVGAFNFYVVIRLLLQAGLRPVFVDADPDTLAMDLADLRRKLTPRTQMVLASHLFGIPSPIGEIAAVCRQHGLLLFEDCAHAAGSRCGQGRHLGAHGDGALFSFGVEKMINCFGGGMLALPRGGAVPAANLDRVSAAEDLLDHGARALVTAAMSPRTYRALVPSGSTLAGRLHGWGLRSVARLLSPPRDDPEYRFQAAGRAPFRPYMIGMMRRQLARLNENIARRLRFVEAVKQGLAGVDGARFLDEGRHGSWNGTYFGVHVADPHGLARTLLAKGIHAKAEEFLDCASLRQFSELAGHCPGARYAQDHLLRLPSHPDLTGADAARIVRGLTEALRGAPKAPLPPARAEGS